MKNLFNFNKIGKGEYELRINEQPLGYYVRIIERFYDTKFASQTYLAHTLYHMSSDEPITEHQVLIESFGKRKTPLNVANDPNNFKKELLSELL